MNQRLCVGLGIFLILLIISGCAGGGDKSSPIEPGTYEGADLSQSLEGITPGAGRLLLGYWDVTRNPNTGEFEVVPLRMPAFHVNVVSHLQNPNYLGVKVYKEDLPDSKFELDVTLTHPFPNSDLRGFDVRGIIFGAGPSTGPETLSSKDDPDLMWLSPGGLRLDNADGWTRWWNPLEFGDPGLFGYTPGLFGTSGFTCQATVNPYKYFANVLSVTSPVVGTTMVDTTNRGTFATDIGPVTRRYQITFPMVGGYPDARFQYAADASWAKPTGGGSVPGISNYPPDANCAEPFHIEVIDNSTAYYVSPAECGGDLLLDLVIYDWGIIDPGFTNIDDEIESISIECDTLFTGVVPVQVASGSSGLSGVYSIAVPTTPTTSGDHEVFVKVVSRGPSGPHTYAPPTGISDDYPGDSDDFLSAFALVPVYVKEVNPEVLGGFGSSGNATDIEADGTINYFLDDVDGFVILDVSDPDNPFILNTVPLLGNPIAFDLGDGHAYIIDNAGNILIVIDVDPVDSASVVNTVGLAATPTAIDVDGDVAIIGDTFNNLNFYNVSIPESPSYQFLASVPGVSPPSAIASMGYYAYVTADDFEIYYVDIYYAAFHSNTVVTSSNLTAVAVSEMGYAFIGDVSNNLMAVDIDPVGSAAIVDTLALTGQVNDIKCDWNMVYAAVSGEGLKIVSFNESTGLSVIGEVDTTADDAVSVDDNIAYLDGEVVFVQLWEEEEEEGETGGWVRTWAPTQDQYLMARPPIGVTVDDNDNIYVTGAFRGIVDFYPGPEGVDPHTAVGGDLNAYLCKYNSAGVYQWTVTWDQFFTRGLGVAIGGNGNIYVVGHGSGDVETLSAYVRAFDHSGATLWQADWNKGSEEIIPWEIEADDSGNCYLSGYFHGTNDLNPGSGTDDHTAAGGADGFLIKLNSSGAYQWGHSWGGVSSHTHANGITLDSSANIFVIGNFQSTVDFDPGPGIDLKISNGMDDIFVCKYNTSGTYQWVFSDGDVYGDHGYGIAVDSTGDIYCTGNGFAGGGGFLSKFDFQGYPLYFLSLGGHGDGVTVDSFGNVYVTGDFHFTGDFDPGPGTDNHTSNGDSDLSLSKFDLSGSYNWTRTWGGVGEDLPARSGFAVDSAGNTYVVGKYNDTVDFDPGPGTENHTAELDDDTFLIKFLSHGYW